MNKPLPLLASLGFALVAAAAASAAHASGDRDTDKPLRPVSDCLDITRINELYVRNDRSLIVRSGPNHFMIDLKNDCPQLGIGGNPRLVAASAPVMQGRMCGDLGEKVVTISGVACAVRSVTPISEDMFKTTEHQVISGKDSTAPR